MTRKSGKQYRSFRELYQSELLPALVRIDRLRRRRLCCIIGSTAGFLIGMYILLPLFVPLPRNILFYGMGCITILFLLALFRPCLLDSLEGTLSTLPSRNNIIGIIMLPAIALYVAFAILLAVRHSILFVAERIAGGGHMRSELSKRTIKPVVRHSFHDIGRHSANDFVPVYFFKKSRLFSWLVGHYHGNDHFHADLRDSRIQFSWIRASVINDNYTENKQRPLFYGWFFVVELPYFFYGGTFIFPDMIEPVLGLSARGIQELASPASTRLVHLEDAEYEKRFRTYSTDQLFARYVMTPESMRLFTNLEKRAGPCLASFIGHRLCIAIPGVLDPHALLQFTSFASPDFSRQLFHAAKGVRELAEYYSALRPIWIKTYRPHN